MKLNLGSGPVGLSGYINVDKCFENQDISKACKFHPVWENVADIGIFEDETFEEVRASHVLEHFPSAQIQNVLFEWVRVLKPGGILKVAVPDFAWICKKYIEQDEEVNILGYTMGGQVDENDFHKALFDYDNLIDMFEKCGLVDIKRFESDAEDCTRLPVSLNLQGMKPLPVATTLDNVINAGRVIDERPSVAGRVKAVMSGGRLGFLDNQICATKAFAPIGIDLNIAQGVFWGQCLTRGIQAYLNDDPHEIEYIITMDYDTTFTRKDVLALIKTADENPDIDAFVPVQMKRESEGQPLIGIEGKKQADGSTWVDLQQFRKTDLVPLKWGHFGLTLLRVSMLRKLSKPWFLAQPDENGSWSDSRIDEDIYFWRKMAEEGFKACLCPRIVVGHLQLVNTWPDINMKAIHQSCSQWSAKQAPPHNAWK